MTRLLKRSLCFVDNIVSTSPLKEDEDLVRLNHYIWLVFIAGPLALYFAYYNYSTKEFLLFPIIIVFATFLIFSLLFIRHLKKMTIIYHVNNLFLLPLLVL